LLASAPGDEEEARLVRAIWAQVFTVHDFPLGSPQGALEKFHDSLPTPTALRRTAAPWWKPPFEFAEGVDPGAVIDWFNCYSDCESKYISEIVAAGPDDLRAHLIAFLKMLQCQRDCAARPPGGLRLPL
jgi:hypothetical protein